MAEHESRIERAERHVREGEERVARQTRILQELERDGHDKAAARARRLLKTFQTTLALSREHLAVERAEVEGTTRRGDPPGR